MPTATYAPGQRVIIRDAEWIIKDIEKSSGSGHRLNVAGLSSIVRDKEAYFLTELEKRTGKIEVLDPVKTKLVQDVSGHFADTRLYLDTLFRDSPSHGQQIHHGTQGAMDLIPYQADPAKMALSEPRSRILIADAVGLGKTIECGILLTELIARGRGKRILVVALNSMLTQFQKELWSRFSIPLVRLDSAGITRVKNKVPANYNPFYYYDKTIISMDTLKRDIDYRSYLEKGWWDIIVIDEAQNVARRANRSQRSKLAERLADRCDSLIMLSATPHDGRKESFASLMTLLNPAAIDVNDYGPEDIKGMFIRRFKKDIRNQVPQAFPERMIDKHTVLATAEEEETLLFLKSMRYPEKVAYGRSGKLLFRTVLEKAFLSSPLACLRTVTSRIERLEESQDYAKQIIEISELEELKSRLELLANQPCSKLQALRKLLQSKEYSWNNKDTKDRLVVFTERIDTLKYIKEGIKGVLEEEQIATLYGNLSDIEIQQTVEDFGKENSPIRLLIASDIASEGINLHYLSHRMIHFDIPWSLMTFQQRNGRIDRYGQEQVPHITYFVSEFADEALAGDQRILELLINKDEEVQKNIGGPGEFTGLYESEDEEQRVGSVLEGETSTGAAVADEDALETALFDFQGDDFFSRLYAGTDIVGTEVEDSRHNGKAPRLFSDTAYYRQLLDFLKSRRSLQFESNNDGSVLAITPPGGFEPRAKLLPWEVRPDIGKPWLFTSHRSQVMEDIAAARKEENLWPKQNLLWDFHPLLQWLRNDALTSYARQEAPLAAVPTLAKNETLILYRGFVPNSRGQIVVHVWGGLFFRDAVYIEHLDLDTCIRKLCLKDDAVPNTTTEVDSQGISALFPIALEEARSAVRAARDAFNEAAKPIISKHRNKLKDIQDRKIRQLDMAFSQRGPNPGALIKDRHQQAKEKAKQEYKSYIAWVTEYLVTEEEGYTPIVAAFTGDGHNYTKG